MSNIVTASWLKQHLADPTIVVVDIRGSVSSEDLGGGRQKAKYAGNPEAYAEGHIPGSVFVDWTVDIVDPNAEVKAQIASPEAFARAMEVRGIGDDTTVIIADDTGGHLATRLWWALRYMGHDDAAILEGGFNAWLAADGAMTAEPTPVRKGAIFTPQVREALRTEWAAVLGVVKNGGAQIVDARDADTYHGRVQRGSRGGHIPGAINLPAKAMQHADGTWRSSNELRQMAEDAGLDLTKPIIAYCNGGVTATQAMFGLEIAGATTMTNYDGSWNEWGERSDLPAEDDQDLFGSEE